MGQVGQGSQPSVSLVHTTLGNITFLCEGAWAVFASDHACTRICRGAYGPSWPGPTITTWTWPLKFLFLTLFLSHHHMLSRLDIV